MSQLFRISALGRSPVWLLACFACESHGARVFCPSRRPGAGPQPALWDTAPASSGLKRGRADVRLDERPSHSQRCCGPSLARSQKLETLRQHADKSAACSSSGAQVNRRRRRFCTVVGAAAKIWMANKWPPPPTLATATGRGAHQTGTGRVICCAALVISHLRRSLAANDSARSARCQLLAALTSTS